MFPANQNLLTLETPEMTSLVTKKETPETILYENWCENEHINTERTYISPSSKTPMAPLMVSQIHLPLLINQRVGAAAILDLETKGHLLVKNVPGFHDGTYILRTNASVLGDIVGMGKSLTVLAVIALRRVPANNEVIHSIPISHSIIGKSQADLAVANQPTLQRLHGYNATLWHYAPSSHSGGASPMRLNMFPSIAPSAVIHRKYDSVFPTNIIMVRAHLVDQWGTDYISRQTSMAHARITNIQTAVDTLFEFMTDPVKFCEKTPILLVSTARINSNQLRTQIDRRRAAAEVPVESVGWWTDFCTKICRQYEVEGHQIVRAMTGICGANSITPWARVIYDDYDTLIIDDTERIEALSYIFISSTVGSNSQCTFHAIPSRNRHTTNYLTIRTDPEHIKKQTLLSPPVEHRVVCTRKISVDLLVAMTAGAFDKQSPRYATTVDRISKMMFADNVDEAITLFKTSSVELCKSLTTEMRDSIADMQSLYTMLVKKSHAAIGMAALEMYCAQICASVYESTQFARACAGSDKMVPFISENTHANIRLVFKHAESGANFSFDPNTKNREIEAGAMLLCGLFVDRTRMFANHLSPDQIYEETADSVNQLSRCPAVVKYPLIHKGGKNAGIGIIRHGSSSLFSITSNPADERISPAEFTRRFIQNAELFGLWRSPILLCRLIQLFARETDDTFAAAQSDFIQFLSTNRAKILACCTAKRIAFADCPERRHVTAFADSIPSREIDEERKCPSCGMTATRTITTLCCSTICCFSCAMTIGRRCPAPGTDAFEHSCRHCDHVFKDDAEPVFASLALANCYPAELSDLRMTPAVLAAPAEAGAGSPLDKVTDPNSPQNINGNFMACTIPIVRLSEYVAALGPILESAVATATASEASAYMGSDETTAVVEKTSHNKIEMIVQLAVAEPRRKIIVYSTFPGTFITLCRALTAAGVKSTIMRSEQDALTLRNGEISVLCISNLLFVAGLNIEFGDAVIFYHHVPEKNIETQVIGRCQRRGRNADHVLQVYKLYYSQELLAANAASGQSSSSVSRVAPAPAAAPAAATS